MKNIMVRSLQKTLQLRLINIDNKEYIDLGGIVAEINKIMIVTAIVPVAGALFGTYPKKTFAINHSVYNYRIAWFSISKYSYRFQRDVFMQLNKPVTNPSE